MAKNINLSDDGAPKLYLALGDAPADECLAGCGGMAQENLYEDGVPIEGPFCNSVCFKHWSKQNSI